MITVELDRVRELRYTYNSLAEAQKELPNIMRMIVIGNDGPLLARTLLWAGLIDEDPTLTPNRVGDLMDQYVKAGKDPDALMTTVRQAITEHGVIKFIEDVDIKNPDGS